MQVDIPERFQPYFDFSTPPGETPVSFGDPASARGTVGRVGYYESPLGSVFELTAVAEDERAEDLDAFVEELGPVAFEAAVAGPVDADAPAADGRLFAELLFWRMRDVEPDSPCVALDVTLVRARDELIGHAVVVAGASGDHRIGHGRCQGWGHGGADVSVVLTGGRVSVHGVVGAPLFASVHDARANNACYLKGRDAGDSCYRISTGWVFTGRW